MIKFKGFTLSEVLIALLVLGIIVSASVPVIMKLAPNKNVAMIKKAYYTTETIVNSLINDQYYYPDHSFHCQGGQTSGSTNPTTGGTCYYGFDYLAEVQIDNTTNSSSDATSKFACLFASKLNIKEDLEDVCDGSIKEVTTLDGITWNFSGINMSGNSSQLYIDVDGKNNGVNAYSYTNGANKTGVCSDNSTWGNACNGNLTPRIKKNFDRIQIKIEQSGRIGISTSPNIQQDFIDIISGKKKVISADDD